jgi:hypothetical protein
MLRKIKPKSKRCFFSVPMLLPLEGQGRSSGASVSQATPQPAKNA